MLGGVVYLSAPPSYETIAENRGEGARKVSGHPIYDCPIVHQRTLIRFNRAFRSGSQTDTLRPGHISEPAGESSPLNCGNENTGRLSFSLDFLDILLVTA